MNMFWNQHELGHQPGVKKIKTQRNQNSKFEILAGIGLFSTKFGKSKN